ncbi:MAG: tetratricopeptide repeat protein [Burkholderiales bacterium]|nr:tetratricopeptide repeat protein [Burkholderiales bacterium]
MDGIAELAQRAAALHRAGDLAAAIAVYDAILAREPRHAVALHLSGVACFQRGEYAQALDRLRASVNTDGSNADVWANLGLLLTTIGHHRAAVETYERAAALDPAPQILVNMAAAQLAWAQPAAAEATARRVVAADPTQAKAWFTLALALQPQGRMLEALDAATRAASLDAVEEGYAGLKAQIENGIGAPEKARATLEKALVRIPLSRALRFELASLLEYKLGAPEAAVAEYEQVLKLDPRHGPALSQLAFLRGRLADWRDRQALVQRYRDAVAAGSSALSPFAFLSLPSTRAEQRTCARNWVAPIVAAGHTAPELTSRERIRVGYLSADFHTHATAFLAAGLFEAHDRQRFEVFAYSTGPDDRSPLRARLTRAFDRFVDLRDAAPAAVAQAIRDDGIDVLVDLKGHTQDATPLVLAHRPAPIQVHYLGYPGTIEGGLCDYLVGDAIVTPPEHAADYAEAIVTLPGSYQVNDRPRPIADTPPRAALGLPPEGVVFACFNQTYKINPEVFDAWARILGNVEGSVLWLLVRRGDDPAIGNLRREAHARGVDPGRLVFAAQRPNAEYLALYRHADLFLDTWPYNAHTTASDALWAGCPVLTILGDTFASRVAASLVTAVGLPELVTASIDAYVERARALAHDPAERVRLRAYLSGPGRAAGLFDTTATTRALEAAYLLMIEQRRRGAREAFTVAR